MRKQGMKPIEGIEVIPIKKSEGFWNFQIREADSYQWFAGSNNLQLNRITVNIVILEKTIII
jgi:hypothetical protein